MDRDATLVRAQDLLDSIFRLATDLVRGERASLMLRDTASTDFVMAHAIGLAEEVRRQVRVPEDQGIVGRVARSRLPLLVRADQPLADQSGRGGYRTNSFVSVPIVVGDELRGVLNIADPVDADGFAETDVVTLELLARHIGTCLVQQEQDEVLRRQAETDPLTWLFNRRHFDRRLEAEANRAKRSQHLLALLIVDVDRFKQINDRFGHRAGDHVLKSVAAAITQAVRLYDVPTRYGGDEFAVLLPEADTEAASVVARRIIERTTAMPLPAAMADAGSTISLSIGVATYPRPSADPSTLVEAADAAMYRAKRAGGGLRVWQHAFADGSRGSLATGRVGSTPPAPYLADPAHLATAELQVLIPAALAAEWNAVVVGQEGPVITIAMPGPSQAAVDALSRATGRAVYPVYSRAQDLEAIRGRLVAA